MSAKHFDVVIIGGGLGGILCAVILAKEGKKVCVLEKNRQIGGCLQTFALNKRVFDACVHYIGGLKQGHSLHQIFDYAGIASDLRLHELDSRGFDHIMFGNEAESYPIATREHFVEQLLPHFPKEAAALQGYLDCVSDTASRFPLYNLKAPDGESKTSVFGQELTATLSSLTDNERLQQVLAGNNMLYAGVKGQTPFYVHAMSIEAYLQSARKVMPGSSQITKLLWRELQRHGGELHRYAEVKALHDSGAELGFAETTDGQRWYGSQFISAIHPSMLFELTANKGLRPVFRERVKSLRQTPPGVMINIALKPGKVPYKPYNIYWHPSGESLAIQTSSGIQWPDTQALFFTEDEKMPGFAASVTVLVYTDQETFYQWQHSRNITGVHHRRDDIYHQHKEAFADRILEKTFARFPELQAAVEARSVATPLTLRDYTGSPDGSLYGPLKDVAKPGQNMLAVRTKIPNLFLTGQNINMHGVMGVSITAIATCAEILGTDYLLSRVRGA